MSSKRKNDDESGETTAREKKKQKIAIARTISVQPGSAIAGPSSIAPVNSLAGLPNAIDVEKFVEARAFEIDAMQKAIKTAGASSTQRAWQTLPRHLRRRAASHDVRRVPSRLREKAKAEMDPIRKKALGRTLSKLGRNNRISRTDSLLRRQRDKCWLETHIWHAKRMKMENIWGYRLAIHPMEKAYRPSHRASIHGSIVHDASYLTLLELKGTEEMLSKILRLCCDPQGPNPGSKRYLSGSRVLDIHVYEPEKYPFGHVGPAMIIWKPTVLPETKNNTAKKDLSQVSQTEKGKEKAPNISQHDLTRERVVWLQFHPMIHDDVVTALKSAISTCVNGTSSPNSNAVELADLRGQVNVFEIMGPKASQVVKGALSLISQEKRTDFLKFWSSLNDLRSSGSLPRGMIIGFKVNDPRLSFPPKNAKPKNKDQGPTITFPAATLAASELWEESIRNGLSKPKYKKKDLDERRSKNPVPGMPLNPLRQDDRVPVILIQRSLEQCNEESQSIHGWTLIVPGGWSMPFFNSLVFTGTRVSGQRERQTQAYEAGTCYFPRDYPSTKAYKTYSVQRATDEMDKWNRKPPAKRVNYDKLDTRSPWKPDWDVVLGLSESNDDEFISTQREVEMIMEQEHPEVPLEPWLLRGPDIHNIVNRLFGLFNQAGGLLSEINNLRVRRELRPLDAHIDANKLLSGALISVRIAMCGRGLPEDMAMIYSMDDEEHKKSDELLVQAKVIDDELDEQEAEEIPPSDSIIGYATTGNYSLSRGEGFAIGSVSLKSLFALYLQRTRLHPDKNASTSASQFLVKIRNRGSQQCRLAYITVLGN